MSWGAQEDGSGTARQLTATGQRDIPCGIVSWSALKREGKAGMGSQPLLVDWLGTSLLVGGGESVLHHLVLFWLFHFS